jgi:hypothetical protein
MVQEPNVPRFLRNVKKAKDPINAYVGKFENSHTRLPSIDSCIDCSSTLKIVATDGELITAREDEVEI